MHFLFHWGHVSLDSIRFTWACSCRAWKVIAMERLSWSLKSTFGQSLALGLTLQLARGETRWSRARALAKAAGQGRGKAHEGTSGAAESLCSRLCCPGQSVKPRWPGGLRDQPWCYMVTKAGVQEPDDWLQSLKNSDPMWLVSNWKELSFEHPFWIQTGLRST